MDPNSFITRVISMLSRVAVSRLIAIVPPELPTSCLRHTTITNNLHDATKRVDHTANDPASTGQWVTTRASRTRRAIASSPTTRYAVPSTDRRPAARRVNASVDRLMVVDGGSSSWPDI